MNAPAPAPQAAAIEVPATCLVNALANHHATIADFEDGLTSVFWVERTREELLRWIERGAG